MAIIREALAAAVVVTALASGEAAATPTGCGAFSLTGGEKGIEVIDNPPQGPSPGDVRAGWRKLVDENGNDVADVHFVATLTAPGGDTGGDVLASQYFVSFGDDWVATASLYELPNAEVPTRGAGNAVLVVVGGAGRFAGATGAITIEAGDPPTYVFAIGCD